MGFDVHEIDPQTIRSLLDRAPAIVATTPSVEARKGIDSQALLHISAAIWLLMSNPFSKAFLARLGEQAADGVVDFSKWLWTDVIDAVNRPSDPRRVLIITSDVDDARIEFLLPPGLPESDLKEARLSLSTAARGAVAFLKLNEDARPRRLALKYSAEHGRWVPHYFVCEALGVHVAEPTEIDLSQFQGLSIGVQLAEWSFGDEEEQPNS